MNYQKIYNNLIQTRQQSPTKSKYYENHHIIPSCVGGSNDPTNKVKLTPREHYIAHHLLWKIHRTPSLAHAWNNMLRCDKNQGRKFTSKMHTAAREAHREAMIKTMKGEGNHFYGKHHSAKTKKILSELAKKQVKTKEQIESWTEKVAKKPKSAEHKRKIGRKGLVMLKNTNTGKCIRVQRELLKTYDPKIWKNPAAISQKRKTCKYCGLSSTVGNINRWHNENCKNKI